MESLQLFLGPSPIELDIKSKSRQNSQEQHTKELNKPDDGMNKLDKSKPLESGHETQQFTNCYSSFRQHVKLIKNLKCLSVITSCFWFSIAYSMVLTFNPSRAAIVGLTPYQAAQLVSIMGITTCFVRLTHGFILDYNIMTVDSLMTTANIVSALCCIMNPVNDHFEYLAVIAAIFGISGGITNSVPPVIFNKYAGTGNVSEAIAFSLVSFGLGTLIGNYITGKLEDDTGLLKFNYNPNSKVWDPHPTAIWTISSWQLGDGGEVFEYYCVSRKKLSKF